MTHQVRLLPHRVVMATLILLCLGTLPGGADEETPPDLQAIVKELDPARVSAFVDGLQKEVADELVPQETVESAQRDLQRLKEAIDEHIERLGGEARIAGDDPIIKVHTRILVLLDAIEARLPQQDEHFGASRRALLPVPHYDAQKTVGKAANQLHDKLAKLSGHLQAETSDPDEVRAALREVILAQEKLAWEAGWPFTAEEASLVRQAGELTSDAYLHRRKRGVASINERLQKAAQSVGRDRSAVAFVLHRPEAEAEQQAVTEALVERRGAAAKGWMEGTERIDEKQLRRLLESRSR
jgi:hypothetical protein